MQPSLQPARIAQLLTPYAPPLPTPLYDQLAAYLDLLLKWNARTNLTAIRDPEEIVRRHFGESLFTGLHLAPIAPDATLLDFGSGAGFPGLPIQLLHPNLAITLAESQGRKAAFLREAIRTLNLTTEIWPNRVESLPANRQFSIVTLRAVDQMTAAIETASARSARLAILTTQAAAPALAGFTTSTIPLPDSRDAILLLATRTSKSHSS